MTSSPSHLYIMDASGAVVGPVGVKAWAAWFDAQIEAQQPAAPRGIAWDQLDCGTTVSTVFLGVDLGLGDGPPMVFETMVFGDWANMGSDFYQERYSTRAEALAGHERIVATLRGAHDRGTDERGQIND